MHFQNISDQLVYSLGIQFFGMIVIVKTVCLPIALEK